MKDGNKIKTHVPTFADLKVENLSEQPCTLNTNRLRHCLVVEKETRKKDLSTLVGRQHKDWKLGNHGQRRIEPSRKTSALGIEYKSENRTLT